MSKTYIPMRLLTLIFFITVLYTHLHAQSNNKKEVLPLCSGLDYVNTQISGNNKSNRIFGKEYRKFFFESQVGLQGFKNEMIIEQSGSFRFNADLNYPSQIIDTEGAFDQMIKEVSRCLQTTPKIENPRGHMMPSAKWSSPYYVTLTLHHSSSKIVLEVLALK